MVAEGCWCGWKSSHRTMDSWTHGIMESRLGKPSEILQSNPPPAVPRPPLTRVPRCHICVGLGHFQEWWGFQHFPVMCRSKEMAMAAFHGSGEYQGRPWLQGLGYKGCRSSEGLREGGTKGSLVSFFHFFHKIKAEKKKFSL